MEEKRNYLTYDHYIIPVGLHYYGYTGNDIHTRKKQGNYKRTALQYYIDQYGWGNINTTIVTEGLTKKEAEQLEDQLIRDGWKRGDCINKQGSGGEWRDNLAEYNKQYRDSHKEEIKQYKKQYRGSHKEEIKQYYKQWRSTLAGKIYERVHSYNRYHPDRMIITPLEAKDMYELTGYIPDFIKSDDLFLKKKSCILYT